MKGSRSTGNRKRMDGETAIAFAGHRFQQLHPKETCPEWFGRCTTISYRFDDKRRFVVSFSVTPIATNDAISYFQVLVDPTTAETVVLLDRSFDEFVGEELQGFDPLKGPPWTGKYYD